MFCSQARPLRVGEVHIHVERDEDTDEDKSTLFSSREDEEDFSSLNLSTIVGHRRRSSSSIRFADDTDTGTDILVITEENLDDILADPIYDDLGPFRRRSLLLEPTLHEETSAEFETTSLGFLTPFRANIKRHSLVPPFHHRHLLHGVHGMSVGGAGALAYTPSANQANEPGSEQSAQSRRILLTLRRRKSVHRSIHIDPISLLDFSYSKASARFLRNAANWRFNTFTLDTMTGGHCLSQMLVHLFHHYKLVDHFKLNMLSVWKCFRKSAALIIKV